MSNTSSSSPSAPTGPGSRVLRIGVVKAGRVVEERVMKTREQVSVGSSERNQIVLGSPGMPARFELFQLDGSGYVMNFTADMGGRVSIPGGMGELADLRKSSLARDAGGYHQVKLDDASRGRIALGDTSIIFEFVDRPPPAVTAALPSAVMSGFGRGMDWTFTAFVTGSFVFFFGFGLYLSQLDPIVESGLRALPDDLAHLVIEEPPPPEVEQETQQNDDAPTETAQAEQQHSQPSEQASHDRQDVANNAEAQASLSHDVANQVMNEIMGAVGSDAVADSVRDMFAGGNVDGDIGAMLSTATGSGQATGAGSRIREAGGGDGSGTTGQLGVLNNTANLHHSQETGNTPEVVVRRGRVSSSGGATATGGSGEFASSAVSSRLRAAQAAMQRCYETALATAPNLEGRVSTTFTIMESGAVTGVSVDAPNAALGSCVSAIIGRMRFNPGPVGGSVTFRQAFAFSPG